MCGGDGTYRVDIDDVHHPWFGKVYRCPCKRVSDSASFQVRLGSSLADVSLDDIVVRSEETDKMKRYAKFFIDGYANSLTVWGTNGTGKTTMLMAIANHMSMKGHGVVYVTAADLMEYVRAGIGDDDHGPDDRVMEFCRVPVLLLDELTQIKWTEYTQEKIETILDRRYRAEMQTALVCDQDPEQVLAPRFSSRMRSGGYIKIGDPDYRPVIGQMKMDAMERCE